MSTIFTKILTGEIPAYKIYENEFVLAFLDIFPIQPGHILIIPKFEADHFSEVPEPYYSEIFQAAKYLSPAIQKATNCTRVCAKFEGFEVAHCHFHLVPTHSVDDFSAPAGIQAPENELSEMQQKIISFLD